ncbi:hypothetical protein D1094_02365 [Colwellia sp. RSH04]|nr:hypothetical protein D1094_02365 [Colwellia sp. RSH04]
MLEQRVNNYSQDSLWEKLNLSQKFSTCSLGQFGYTLSFVRNFNNKMLAILTLENKIATINEEGIINISPAVSIRAA